MLPVVTGSQALHHYGLLKNRVPADWDLIAIHEKELINTPNVTLDISDANSEFERTNRIIFEKSQSGDKIKSPLGEAVVIPLNLLKVMKLSSLPLNKVKNSFDLEQLNHIILSKEDLVLLAERTLETLKKIELQKSKFFNRYAIPRFFYHDELHLFVSSNPVYKRVLDDQVNVSEERFNNLSDSDKVLLFWEESFVLALERYFIPNVRKFPMMIDSYCEEFFQVAMNSDPSFHWLNRLCAKGMLKDHPDFLAQWGIENYSLLTKDFAPWWSQTFDSIDKSFWQRLLKF